MRCTILLRELVAELRRRDDLLSEHRVDRLDDLPDPPPPVLLLVDNWPSFARHCDGDRAAGAAMAQLLARGPSTGLTVVACGDHEFDLGLAKNFPERFLLPFPDANPYLRFGVEQELVPSKAIPGRAIRTASATTVQFAHVPSDFDIAKYVRTRSSLPAPFRIASLPSSLDLATARARLTQPLHGLRVLLGVGGPNALPTVVDLEESPALLVTGPPRSAVPVLTAVGRQLIERGVQVVVVGGRRSAVAGALPDAIRLSAPLRDHKEALDELDQAQVVVLLDEAPATTFDDQELARFLGRSGRAVVAGMSFMEARSVSSRSPLGAALKEQPVVLYVQPEPDTMLREFEFTVPQGLRLGGWEGRGILLREGEA